MNVGEVIDGRFEIERFAASGGMGAIYRAVDRQTERLAAVKVMQHKELDGALRFEREAAVLASLQHPGIVAYLAHGRLADGRLYLAMEWLEGEDLASRLATAPLTVDETLAMATRAAAALAAAHARDVIHRDVKPSNLFLVDWRPAQVKLLDFGVARLAALPPLTRTGNTVGTPLFMAPEQARGERDIDARADVFALGCVLYLCLTGRNAFVATTPAGMMGRLLAPDEAQRAREVAPQVPAPLEALVARMLRKDRDARPRDGGEVLREILELDATMPAELLVFARADAAAVEAAALAHGGRLVATAEGAAALLPARGRPDAAEQAARCALALRSTGPVALVAGQAGGALEALAGRARALADLPAAGVRIDETSAGLIAAGRFRLGGDAHGLVLSLASTGGRARLAAGDTLDRYRIEGLLGHGGVGSVYRAFDERLERRVALKVVPWGAADGSGTGYLREARAAASLVHPNVVVVHDAGRSGEWIYVAMELVDGRSLREAAAGVGWPRRLRWLTDVARALEAAGALGIVHGDVKPDNVLVAADGVAKLCDFGLARRDGGAQPPAGTPGYASPEQLRGDPIDARADQFSWAATAYEVLSGAHPRGTRPPLLEQAPDLPPEIAATIDRALSPEPGDRFPGMGAIVDALDPYGATRGRTPTPSAAPRRPRRSRLPAVALGLLACAGVGLVALRLRRGGGDVVAPAASPEAARLLALGDRLWRTHSLVQATDAWTRAIALDPELSPALLRLALESMVRQSDTVTARERYRAAAAAPDRLDARGRALLAASAPLFAATPDVAAWQAALAELVARAPGDGELLYWKAHAELMNGQPQAARRTARAAIAADPDFLQPYTLEWSIAEEQGEDHEPLLRRCAERFPRSGSCAGALVWLAMVGSDCERLDRLGQEYAAAVPDHFIGDRGRALAFYARGAPGEAVAELLRRAEQRMSPEAREHYGTLLPELAIAGGDLAAAERARRAELERLATVADLGPRAMAVAQLADLLWEEGRADEARALVRDLLRREETFEAPRGGTNFQRSDGRAELLEVAGRIEALPAADLERAEQRLLAEPQRGMRAFSIQAMLARTREQALAVSETPLGAHPAGWAQILRARVRALAGRPVEAIADLRAGLARCDRLTWALAEPRAHLQLGALLEEQGDRDGARTEYEAVVARWGPARPRSITAEEARRRLAALSR